MTDEVEQQDAEVETYDTADVYEGSIMIYPATDHCSTTVLP